MDHTITIIESQLDWLTCSNKGDDNTAAFRDLAVLLSDGEACEGGMVSPFQLHNYRGWRVGRCGYGTHGGATILALSGDLADRAFASAVPLATNVSRVDAAVTVRVEPWDVDIGREAFNAASGLWLVDKRRAKPLAYAEPDHFTNCYVGTRASETFLRLYDKWGESGEDRYRYCWRYEVESKATLAGRLAVACLGSTDRAAFCQGYVYDKYVRAGITPWWGSDTERVLVRGFRRRADTDRKLAWLRRSVAPSVAKLSKLGLTDDCRAALGL